MPARVSPEQIRHQLKVNAETLRVLEQQPRREEALIACVRRRGDRLRLDLKESEATHVPQ